MSTLDSTFKSTKTFSPHPPHPTPTTPNTQQTQHPTNPAPNKPNTQHPHPPHPPHPAPHSNLPTKHLSNKKKCHCVALEEWWCVCVVYRGVWEVRCVCGGGLQNVVCVGWFVWCVGCGVCGVWFLGGGGVRVVWRCDSANTMCVVMNLYVKNFFLIIKKQFKNRFQCIVS